MKNKSGIKTRIMIMVFVMVILLHAVLSVSAFAEEVSQPVAEETYEPASVIFTDEGQLGEVQQIHLPFPNVTEEKIEWDFPYSDEFFSLPSEEFSITIARGSMGLTLSAFRSSGGEVSPQYETYLREAGFTNIYGFGYDESPAEDSGFLQY